MGMQWRQFLFRFIFLLFIHPSIHFFPYALLTASLWFLSMSVSRLYMGVHCTYDIAAGWILGLLTVVPIYFTLGIVDPVIMYHHHSPIIVFSIALFLVLLYPVLSKPVKWTNTYGDTTLILGVATGVFWGSFANSPISELSAYPIFYHLPCFEETPPVSLLFALFRCIVGYALLIGTRSVLKTIGTNFMVFLLPKSSTNPKNRYGVEIPTKFLTYSGIGFNAVYTVPYLFTLL